MNTKVEVLRNLQRLAEVTTRERADVSFTLRPQDCRPRIVARTGADQALITFELHFIPAEILPLEQVQMEILILEHPFRKQYLWSLRKKRHGII